MSRKVQVMLTIDTDRLERLDALAEKIADGNRSEAVRRLVDASHYFFASDGTVMFRNDSTMVTEAA